MREFFDRVDALLDGAHGLAIGIAIMFVLGVCAMQSLAHRKARP